MKLKKIFKLVLLVLVVGILISCGKKKEEKPLIMGLSPIANSEKMLEDAEPLYKILGEQIGKDVNGYIASNYIGLVEALGTGTVDFALIPPFAYILANKKVEDLKGKRIAFVDPSSTSGYIFPAVILKDHGIDIEKDITSQFAGGHDKALQLLVNGDVDAIGTYEGSITKFAKEFPDVENQVKVLQKSDLIPGITLTVSSKLAPETKEKIKDAFLKVTATPEGQELTLKLFGIKGFQEADINSYKTIEDKLNKMGIDIEKIK